MRLPLTTAPILRVEEVTPSHVQRWFDLLPTNDQNSSNSTVWALAGVFKGGNLAAAWRISFKTVLTEIRKTLAISRIPELFKVIGTIKERIKWRQP